MKRVKLLSIITLLCASVPAAIWAQTPEALASWNMTGITGGPSPWAPTASSSNVTVIGLTRGSGASSISSSPAGSAWGANSFYDNVDTVNQTELSAVNLGNYISFAVAPAAGYTESFTSIGGYNIRRSGTGPSLMAWQYSIDGTTFTDIGSPITIGTNTSSPGNDQPAIDLTGIDALQNVPSGTSVKFRIVLWKATSAAGTWYFNSLGTNVANRILTVNGILNTTSPLPLNLLSFNGLQEQGANRLDWVTTQEKNVSHFELERGTDGSHFNKIAQINSVTENGDDADNEYSYEDYNATTTSFYRLKMVDVSGNAGYSNIVVLRSDVQQKNITLYPNPVESSLFIEGLKGVSSYRITDAIGKEVISTIQLNGADGNVTSVNVSALNEGIYFIQLKDENGTTTIRFVRK